MADTSPQGQSLTLSFLQTTIYPSSSGPPVADPFPLVDAFHVPLTRPNPREETIHASLIPFTMKREEDLPENVTLDKWYTPLSINTDAIRLARERFQRMIPMAYEGFEPIPPPPLLPTNIPWYRPLDHEFRTFTMRVLPTLGNLGDIPRSEVITSDKWYTPLALPVLPRPFPMDLFVNRTTDDIPRTEVITVDKWWTPFTQNFHRDRLPLHVYHIFSVGPESREAEFVGPDKLQSMSVPYRVQAELSQAMWMVQDILFIIPEVPGLPITWYTPLSEPIFVPDTPIQHYPLQDFIEVSVEFIPAFDSTRGRVGDQFSEDQIAKRPDVQAECPGRPDVDPLLD